MGVARPRPKVMTLTDRAADRVRSIMSRSDAPAAGLRIGIKTGGCAGMEYTMDYASAAGPADEVIEDKGVTVLIDPKAIMYLLGTEMDFVTEKMTQRFVFNNPNQTSACGCGESVAITPALPETYVSAAG
jgi:iron-sulfur cluster assembly protein